MKNKALFVHSSVNKNPQNHNYVKKLQKILDAMVIKEDTTVQIEHPNLLYIRGLDGYAQALGRKIITANIYHSDDCHIRNNGWCTCDPDIKIVE